jgi:hypothetical protein
MMNAARTGMDDRHIDPKLYPLREEEKIMSN